MTVFAILAGLFGLFLFLIAVPIELKFQFDSLNSPRFRMRIGWLFSLVELDLPHRKQSSKQSRKRVKPKRKRTGYRVFLKLLSRPLLLRFLDFIRKTCRAVHLKQLRADIRAGLGEPADTGILFGAVSALFPFRGMTEVVRMQWEPDFGQEPVIEGTSEGTIRLRPIEMAPAVIGFVFSKPVLKTMIRGMRLWTRK